MTTGFYNKYLLFIAGLGGLLYGIDVGVIAGALPYLQATTNYSPAQLSSVVAAVLLGSVLSSLFAGSLAEWMGRKWLMILSGVCFVLSVPVICLPSGFAWLVTGRILQGAAAGFIGVVVPLYLAECLTPDKRGFGTGMFQFMLTIGLVFAALVGLGFSMHVDAVKAAGGNVFGAMEFAWKAIFWACAVPGVIFTAGAFAISESPRWLFGKGKKELALAALTRSRGPEQAKLELAEMDKAPTENTPTAEADKPKDSLLQKKYIVPFVLAVIILACNQATGVNSVLAYIVDVLRQAGLDGAIANWGDLVVKILNMVMTIFAMLLVDRKGRKFLLTIGTSGIILGLLGVAVLFFNTERKMEDYTAKLTPALSSYTKEIEEVVTKAGAEVKDEKGNLVKEKNSYDFYAVLEPKVLSALIGKELPAEGAQVKFVYKQDGEMGMKTVVIKPFVPVEAAPIDPQLTGIAAAKAKVEALKVATEATAKKLKAWTADLTVKVAAQQREAKWWDKLMNKVFGRELPEGKKDFTLESFEVGPLPSASNGWLVTFFFALFIASFAIGPGVCVWLALSELMPNRIRAVGMSVALLINQGVSTVIAGTFLPVVANWGYSTIFFFCAGCTVIYWITAVFFLPETKGRTLEEIEAHFEGKKRLS